MQVFRMGEGPPVILLHEVTGLSPQTFELGQLIAESGFSVYLPLLFGKPGEDRFVKNFVRACTGGWFHCFNRNQSNDPALVETLLELSRRISAEHGQAAVGVIGMCLTGNTGLELAGSCSPVRAIVASQPSLPFGDADALGVSQESIDRVKALQIPVLAFRFSADDSRSPVRRMNRLQSELGGQLTRTDIPPGPGIRKKPHSVLTGDFVDKPGHPTRQALDDVLNLFHQTLDAGTVALDCP